MAAGVVGKELSHRAARMYAPSCLIAARLLTFLADFDAYASPPDLKLEARPRGPLCLAPGFLKSFANVGRLPASMAKNIMRPGKPRRLHLMKLYTPSHRPWGASTRS